MTTLQDMIAKLPRKEQEAIAARTRELIAEELTLRDVRKALNLSQEQLARSLNVKQANVSQMEARTDLLISTVSSYIEAMGGSLDLVVRFKDRPPVKLTGFAALHEKAKPARIEKKKPARTRRPHATV